MSFSAAIWDIETSALEAVGAGCLLCAGVKPVGGEPRMFRLDKYRDPPGIEKELLTALIKALYSHDLLIAHYGDEFDWQYIKSRAVSLGIPMAHPAPLSYDTWKAFKRLKLRTRLNIKGKPSAALDMVCDFFHLKNKKTHILPNRQWEIIWNSKGERAEAMQELVDHCIADVEMTEEIYKRLFAMDSRVVIKRYE